MGESERGWGGTTAEGHGPSQERCSAGRCCAPNPITKSTEIHRAQNHCSTAATSSPLFIHLLEQAQVTSPSWDFLLLCFFPLHNIHSPSLSNCTDSLDSTGLPGSLPWASCWPLWSSWFCPWLISWAGKWSSTMETKVSGFKIMMVAERYPEISYKIPKPAQLQVVMRGPVHALGCGGLSLSVSTAQLPSSSGHSASSPPGLQGTRI